MEKDIMIGKAFKDAWQGMKKNWIVLIGLFVVMLAVTIVLYMLLGKSATTIVYAQNGTIMQQTLYSQLPLNILSILVGTAFSVIMISVILDCARGKEPSFSFSVSKYFFLLLLAAVCFIAVMGFIAGIELLIVLLGGFVFLLTLPIGFVFLYVMLRLMFYSFIYLDKEQNMSIVDSVKESWKITKGNELNLFLFLLAAIGIIFLGFLALLLGALWTIPLVYLAQGFVYLQLVNNRKEDIIPTQEIEEEPQYTVMD